MCYARGSELIKRELHSAQIRQARVAEETAAVGALRYGDHVSIGVWGCTCVKNGVLGWGVEDHSP